jgi:predicted peptidase
MVKQIHPQDTASRTITAMIERFTQMPSALRAAARGEQLPGRFGSIPALLVHPDWSSDSTAPTVIWMHGRTVNKELDPGRYLRWMRAGLGVCAIDLPGHGERLDAQSQTDEHALDVVQQMVDEIDDVVAALRGIGAFDMQRLGIGGMSAGGMATLARLCRPHEFKCASVEATTGSWAHQRDHGMFANRTDAEVAQLDPMQHLDAWREIPFQAFHSRLDKRVAFGGQEAFINALRGRYQNPALIDFVVYDKTGVPDEHSGFGVLASEAKDRQRDFFQKWL